jgi:ribosomal protein S18 acetylase RimI-like enzyme
MCYLKFMEVEEFESYVAKAISTYATELAKSGEFTEKSADFEAKNAFYRLLPDGLKTKNQFIFNIHHENNQVIGVIWYGLRSDDEGFIYDFEIDETYRGKGYGKEALVLLEEHARSMHVKKLGLHVFGHNKHAYELYIKMGFNAYSIQMSKEI